MSGAAPPVETHHARTSHTARTHPAALESRFEGASAITPERLKAHLEFIASDELEGRDTPSKGLDVATLYVATMLKLWGAQPAGDSGTYFQQIPLGQRLLDTAASSIDFGGNTYRFGDGFKNANRQFAAEGKLIYAGHGFVIKKKDLDPFAGLDVKGKIVVVSAGMPKGYTYGDLQGQAGVDYETPEGASKARGAVAMIRIPDESMLSRWNPEDGRRITWLSPGEAEPDPNQLATVTASPVLAKALFEGAPMTAEEAMKGSETPEKAFAFSDRKTIDIHMAEQKIQKFVRNVVAIVPGSDEKLKSEFVAFGAHIDHVGMQPGGTGDRIFNGADDDGSGTVAILEIAHAFLSGKRPRRSCIFVWHCGEEKGLWGSTYFTEHPTVDLKQIVTQLNIDMIGRSKPTGDTNPANKMLTGPNEIYVVGSTLMSTDLQKLSESVNASFLHLSFNYHYDEPKDPEAMFSRSDHYNYAKKGVPIIFYFDGVHEDYHRPSDEVSKIDFHKLSSVAKTVYATGFTLASAPKRPVVDKKLPGG